MELNNNSLLEELEATKKELKETKKELTKSNNKLNILRESYNKLFKRICDRQNMIENNWSHLIIENLIYTNYLTQTARELDCNPDEIYLTILDWVGLPYLKDYKFYHNKIEGRHDELDEFIKLNHSKIIKDLCMRTPEKEELDIIFTEYLGGKLTLYEISDKYNIIIINLFRLLKEHKLIEKESDAIGYEKFYKEYIGEYDYNKYNIKDLGLIDMYYKLI